MKKPFQYQRILSVLFLAAIRSLAVEVEVTHPSMDLRPGYPSIIQPGGEVPQLTVTSPTAGVLEAWLVRIDKQDVAAEHAAIGIDPMANGDWEPQAYENVAKLAAWMQVNAEAIHGTRALPEGETTSFLASTKGDVRYLYLLPDKKEGTLDVSFTGWRGDCKAQLQGDTRKLEVTRNGDTVSLAVPAIALGETVRVLKLSP